MKQKINEPIKCPHDDISVVIPAGAFQALCINVYKLDVGKYIEEVGDEVDELIESTILVLEQLGELAVKYNVDLGGLLYDKLATAAQCGKVKIGK